MVPSRVRAAFRAPNADVSLLSDGVSPAYRLGDIVLKEVGDATEADFIADVMSNVHVDESLVRMSRPLRADDGSWIVDGWAAWEFIEGSHAAGPHDWHAVASAIAAFNEGLSQVRTQSTLPSQRRHRWAIADRVAWDEEIVALHPRVAELVEGVRSLQSHIDAPTQLIHGDIASNVLFRPDGPPAIIDFSPYRRPAAHSLAIYLVDAVGWHEADRAVLDLLASDSDVQACLPRAAIFRLVALDCSRREDGVDISRHLPDYERICAAVAEHVGR